MIRPFEWSFTVHLNIDNLLTDLARYVGVVGEGEVAAVQGDAASRTELVEALAGGLEQAQSAEVALLAADAVQVLQAAEGGRVVEGVGSEHELARFLDGHLRPEVADRERDGLAVEAVAWVPD